DPAAANFRLRGQLQPDLSAPVCPPPRAVRLRHPIRRAAGQLSALHRRCCRAGPGGDSGVAASRVGRRGKLGIWNLEFGMRGRTTDAPVVSGFSRTVFANSTFHIPNSKLRDACTNRPFGVQKAHAERVMTMNRLMTGALLALAVA